MQFSVACGVAWRGGSKTCSTGMTSLAIDLQGRQDAERFGSNQLNLINHHARKMNGIATKAVTS